jgi:hypothetical protein
MFTPSSFLSPCSVGGLIFYLKFSKSKKKGHYTFTKAYFDRESFINVFHQTSYFVPIYYISTQDVLGLGHDLIFIREINFHNMKF